MPTREEYKSAIARAQAAGDAPAVADLVSRARSDAGVMDTVANLGENFGAGLDTFVQGGKQLVGLGIGDEKLKEKRAHDAALAEMTPGGSIAQVVGEAAPSFLIPGGGGARVLTKAVGALRGVPAAAQAARIGTGMGMAGSALEAGAAGLLMPTTSDESKLANVAGAAAFGAGAPLLLKTLGAGGRALGRTSAHVGAALPESMGGQRFASKLGAESAATALKESDVPLNAARYRAQDYQPNTMPTARSGAHLEEFNPSTAAAYHGTPELAQVEKAVRQFDAPTWAARDEGEAAKRWARLDENLRGTADVDAVTARLDTMDPPYASVSPKKFDVEMAKFTRSLENMTNSPAYIANPTVRGTVDTLRKQIDSNTITPETLHEFRKTLKQGIAGPPGMSDAAIRGARSDPNLMGLVNQIDNVMESAAYAGKGTQWANWRGKYSAGLAEGEGAKAEEMLRRKFVDEHGVPLGGGPVPSVTPSALSKTAAKLRTVQTGPRVGQPQFTKQANQAVADVMENLNAAGVVDRVKKAATLGGSDTAYNLTSMGMTGVIGDLLMGSMGTITGGALALTRSKHAIEAAKRKVLTDIMQDPQKFRQFVAAVESRTQQLAQQGGLSGTARYGAAGATAAIPALDEEQENAPRR